MFRAHRYSESTTGADLIRMGKNVRIDKKFREPDGHLTQVLKMDPDAATLKQDVIEVLEQVWLGSVIYDEDIDLYNDTLKEFGVDLEKELRSRGMDDPFADKKDRLIKDRGDIGEVLGYLKETKLRGILPDDMFAPLVWAKLKGGLTTHGIDGIGFVWETESDTAQMILCEWKHTTQTGSITSPCTSASEAWVGLTPRKLLQELKRVRRFYEYRSEHERAKKIKWFVLKWLQRDPSVLCVTTVVYPDTTSVERARREVSTHLVKTCTDDHDNPIGPCMHECNLLPLPDLVGFVDSCYQEFFYGS